MARELFGDLTPDQPAHLNAGLMTCDGVYAIQNGYSPLPQFSAVGNGMLPGRAIGATAYRVGSDTLAFAGTATDIYRYQASGFTSLITGMTTTQANGLRFAQYNTLMLATNGSDPIKKFDPTAPGSFTNLGGTPPTGRFIAVVGAFVVLGFAANDGLRIVWSDNGIPTTWTAGTGEAGFYQMPTGGDITGIVGGEYGLIFQENRILRMVYTADDTIWQFQEVAKDIGCIAPNSIATYGNTTYFLSNKGLMSTDGTTINPIGAEKVDRTFLSLANRTNFSAMSAVVDPKNSLYMVTLPSANPPNTSYVFNYLLGKWTTASVSAQLLFGALAQGLTLEQLDALYGQLELVPVSLDDASFRGGYPLLMLFNSANQLGSLSGPTMKATFVDSLSEIFQGFKARVKSIRLLTDAKVANVTVQGSNQLGDVLAGTTYTQRQGGGGYKVRENWSFIQNTVEIPAGTPYSFIQGLDLEAQQGGRP